MCGISGGFGFTQTGMVQLYKIEAANQMLTKRGPDGGNIFTAETVALGHRRLSIIDVSCAGDQPMHTPDGKYTIIFNGEIFNYEKLQQQYLSADEQKALRSHSDTEIFLMLYVKMKEKVFALLQGFFAAAIYDHTQNQITLVRDRYGKKPLLYYHNSDYIFFASEMKALFAAGIPKKVNWNVLPVYLQLNYIPQPYSMVENVQKLKAGHYLTINANGIAEHCYYQLKTKPHQYTKYNYEGAQKELIRVMDASVQMRLISDVPLGAFLSGGIDSSVVVALAAQHTGKLNTFSIGYKDNPFFDETAYANLVAKKYKTNHTVFSLSNNDFLEHVYNVLNYIDEPFADSSSIPEFILCYYTRKYVTVALSGDGGDEVFAGYNKHAGELRMRNKNWRTTLVRGLHPLWQVLPKSRSNKLTNLFRQLHRFSAAAHLSPADRYWQLASLQTKEKAFALLKEDKATATALNFSDAVRNQFSSGMNGDFNEVLLADMNLVLLSDMLVKVDLMSMANSLEIRSPFIDQDVVEFAFGLPVNFKISNGIKKRIVQDAFRNMLPAELYNRPKKGFEIPLLQWLRTDLWNMINDDLLNKKFVEEQGIFKVAATEALKAKLRSQNPGDSHATIWALVVFQYWWKKYFM
jgi:asparagine synthase (glutamine-hydrolysing)